MKLKFGFVKLCYRGLKKNAIQLFRGVRAGESVLAGKNGCSQHQLARHPRLLIAGEPPKRTGDRRTSKSERLLWHG
jgi:hypothetical protein